MSKSKTVRPSQPSASPKCLHLATISHNCLSDFGIKSGYKKQCKIHVAFFLFFFQESKERMEERRKSVLGKTMVSQRCPHPNPWNLRICYLTWPTAAQGIEVASQLILKEGDCLWYPDGPTISRGCFKVEEGGRIEEAEGGMRIETDLEAATLLSLSLRKWRGARERGLPPEGGSLLELPEEHSPSVVNTVIFSPVSPTAVLASRTMK